MENERKPDRPWTESERLERARRALEEISRPNAWMDPKLLTEKIRQRIEEQIKSDRVVLYMKGTPESPMCRFSADVAQLLAETGVHFKFYDVLADSDLQLCVRQYSGHPTYPQVFVDGKLVGGRDTLFELKEKGAFPGIFAQDGDGGIDE